MTEAEHTYFQSKKLLSAPSHRAAFSDRMAWMMSELSRLAYFPFEGDQQVEQFLKVTESILANDKQYKMVETAAKKLLTGHGIGHSAAEKIFTQILADHEFELVGLFNEQDTQGFVAKRNNQAFLVYRGTESFGDMKADINARLVDAELNGIKAQVHAGFWQQFTDAHERVGELLAKVHGMQLFIGGHSLGGALANLATKFYASDTSGCTYTFGAPAVAAPSFQDDIKTPIYRIVNARDPVPLLPNPMLAHGLSFLWYYGSRFIGIIGTDQQKAIGKMLKDMRTMDQIGYPSRIVYVGSEPKLRYSFGIFQRLKLWWQEPWFNWTMEKRFIAHHRIGRYSSALRKWGEHRLG